MCGRRGLIPDTDEQIFEIAITPTFRTQYFQILVPILAEVRNRKEWMDDQ